MMVMMTKMNNDNHLPHLVKCNVQYLTNEIVDSDKYSLQKQTNVCNIIGEIM